MVEGTILVGGGIPRAVCGRALALLTPNAAALTPRGGPVQSSEADEEAEGVLAGAWVRVMRSLLEAG